MWGIGITFGCDFDTSAPSSPEPKKKQAPKTAPQVAQQYAPGPSQPTFWERMFFINDAYIPDPGYGRTPETLAAHMAKEALQKPKEK